MKLAFQFLSDHTLLSFGIKGKKKIPDFQSRTVNRSEQTRAALKHSNGKLKQLIIQNLDDYKVN